MVNICRFVSILGLSWGGLLVNKNSLNNCVYLLTLLCLFLTVHVFIENKGGGLISILFVLANTRVLLAFKTKRLLIFYMCFEFSLIPTVLIIFIYGYQPEKLQASFALLLYTVTRRLPLLFYILHFDIKIARRMVTLWASLSFIIKTPLFIFHIWLPKAHVEAPIGGSMILAGLLLKLGSYGLILFLPTFKLNTVLVYYYSISLLDSIMRAILRARQGDLKLLIAYSSVVHIGIVRLGLLRGTEMGYCSRIIMIIRHGLCSPFIFAFVN